MKPLIILTKRNSKLYFKDKGMFFSSLITPMILLVLYATFLAKVYRESFKSGLSAGFNLSDQVIRSEEHTSELQSPLIISYAVFCLKKKIRYKLCFALWQIHNQSPLIFF